jgi:3-oxoacyl-[acyl-carrier protein] reductase
VDLRLHGRVYVITGGSRGLGFAAAQALAAEGARVVVSARDPAAVDRARQKLGPGLTAGVAADNADPATPGRLAAAAQQAFGRLDGALISVGGPPVGPAMATADETWRQAFEGVFLGAVRLARDLGAELGEGGALAFVLSSSVREPIAGLAVSNGLRPGLAGVAKTLAAELGPRGIRVNGLLPGRIATSRVAELDATRGDPATVRAEAERAIPLRRYGEPEEFGRVAAFVLSPAASYLTGAMIPVDGGLLRGL